MLVKEFGIELGQARYGLAASGGVHYVEFDDLPGDKEREDVDRSVVGASMIEEDILAGSSMIEIAPLRQCRTSTTQLLEVETGRFRTTERCCLVFVATRFTQLQDRAHD